ncbi:hypothetical protein, variant [Aphanomyces invadans]|uniref:Uncharacterized protein n=1 Tax=Aphanomyces invadans TaxID=157072 RepID=A0A024UI43_9STRA|nr:hypothetical protein, variant [Aphanomyces invadans]ETW05288.1 hypothetical protein, variant [Aphanomyces invadans]|eukprot:XP_008866725.1 hypothetical protein, variant [Aphanomyces invadans]
MCEANAMLESAGDGDLDVWKDLRFLLATDDDLHEDLAHVCDLLDASSAEDDTQQVPTRSSCTSEVIPGQSNHSTGTGHKRKMSKNAPPRTDLKNAYESRQKHELYALRQQVDVLRAELERRQAAASSAVAVTSFAWQTAARQEFIAMNQSLRERAQLRDAIDDNTTFIDRMQLLLRRKKPRIPAPEQLDWQSLKLAAHSSLRTAAMHAIADRQLRRLQSAFIQASVYESAADVFNIDTTLVAKGHVQIRVVEHVSLPAPWNVIGDAVWDVFGGLRRPALPPMASETLEEIESVDNVHSGCTTTTIYSTYKEITSDTNLAVYSNVIRKRYRYDAAKDMIVWRSVKEDARMPQAKDSPTEDEAGWYGGGTICTDPLMRW